MCMIWPEVIQKAVDSFGNSIVPNDTVIDELKMIAAQRHMELDDLAIAMAVYILGLGGYKGLE